MNHRCCVASVCRIQKIFGEGNQANQLETTDTAHAMARLGQKPLPPVVDCCAQGTGSDAALAEPDLAAPGDPRELDPCGEAWWCGGWSSEGGGWRMEDDGRMGGEVGSWKGLSSNII